MRAVLSLLLAGLLALPAAADTPRVEGMRAERAGETVRLVFALDAPVTPRPFTLADPPRLVIDFHALDWPGGPPEAAGLPGVTALRFGVFRPGRMRMVIGLDGPLLAEEVFVAPEGAGHVLEIALRRVSPETFAAASGWPEGALWRPEPRATPGDPGDIVVAIDPGHGGLDPGAAREGLVEKEVVLEVAHALAARLSGAPGIAAFLTREDDRFVPLRGRIRLAREAGAHVFVSLHADALEQGHATGVSVYTLSQSGADYAAEEYAARENRADVLAGADLAGRPDDVTSLLIDLARRGTRAESEKLAGELVTALGAGQGLDLLDTRPHRKANLLVLRAPDLPSVLVELGFLTSAEDRARLRDPAWRARVVEGLAAGIEAWTRRADPGFVAPRG